MLLIYFPSETEMLKAAFFATLISPPDSPLIEPVVVVSVTAFVSSVIGDVYDFNLSPLNVTVISPVVGVSSSFSPLEAFAVTLASLVVIVVLPEVALQ